MTWFDSFGDDRISIRCARESSNLATHHARAPRESGTSHLATRADKTLTSENTHIGMLGIIQRGRNEPGSCAGVKHHAFVAVEILTDRQTRFFVFLGLINDRNVGAENPTPKLLYPFRARGVSIFSSESPSWRDPGNSERDPSWPWDLTYMSYILHLAIPHAWRIKMVGELVRSNANLVSKAQLHAPFVARLHFEPQDPAAHLSLRPTISRTEHALLTATFKDPRRHCASDLADVRASAFSLRGNEPGSPR